MSNPRGRSHEEPRTLRLFFALWPQDAVRDRLFEAGRALHAQCGGRLVPRVQLHQTLLFLGSVARERVPEISAWLNVLRVPAFSLPFGSIGYWRRNQIVWAAPLATPQPLLTLVSALQGRARAGGFKIEDRPYASHVTLLRDARAPELLPELAFEWPASECALLQSVSAAHGVEYRVLARAALA